MGGGGKGKGKGKGWGDEGYGNAAAAHGSASRLAATAASSVAAAAGPGAKHEKPDPLTNPLRAVLTGFMCKACGYFDEEGQSKSGVIESGDLLCRRCAAGEDPSPKRCAYTSVMYGEAPQYVLGALVLGYSLKASGTQHERVLLHTADVPSEARPLLAEFWRLQEVEYIISAQDLHTAPYDKARFKEVFTKLQIFNPGLLPFDRVVFLDLDMLVLKNIDELFQLRPPAAMCNMKSRGSRRVVHEMPEHGARMEPSATYINAGTMVVAPSMWLHDILARDVQEPDPEWHRASWSPEQAYLSSVLAGEWRHVSQLYNLEVQLHSGVPLSEVWQSAEATDVAVAHFSGAQKVWDLSPDADVSVVGSDWVRRSFAQLPERVCTNTSVRCQALHAEWHRALSLAVRECRDRGLAERVGPRWAALLRTGSPQAWQASPEAPLPVVQPGEVAVLREGGQRPTVRLCTVVRSGADGSLVVWSTPYPVASRPFCAGDFGLCHALGAEEAGHLELLGETGLAEGEGEEADVPVGSQAAISHGRGSVIGTVVAARRDLRLVRSAITYAPRWKKLLEIIPGPVSQWEELECTRCRRHVVGRFDEHGFWCCNLCASRPTRECPAA